MWPQFLSSTECLRLPFVLQLSCAYQARVTLISTKRATGDQWDVSITIGGLLYTEPMKVLRTTYVPDTTLLCGSNTFLTYSPSPKSCKWSAQTATALHHHKLWLKRENDTSLSTPSPFTSASALSSQITPPACSLQLLSCWRLRTPRRLWKVLRDQETYTALLGSDLERYLKSTIIHRGAEFPEAASRLASAKQARQVGGDGHICDGQTNWRKPTPQVPAECLCSRPGADLWVRGWGWAIYPTNAHTPGKLSGSVSAAVYSPHSLFLRSPEAAQVTGRMGAYSKRPCVELFTNLLTSKILLLCLLALGKELNILSHRWEMLRHHSLTPEVPLPDGPRPDPSQPFHCSFSGRAADWTCKLPVLTFYVTEPQEPSGPHPLGLGVLKAHCWANIYFSAIYQSNLALAMLKLDCFTNKSDLELTAILISVKEGGYRRWKPGCSLKALERQNLVWPHLAGFRA